jgi:hypothetical protein
MALEDFTAKNLEIKTKSAHALLNDFKTGKLKTELLSCLSSAFVQNSTSFVSITDSETTGADLRDRKFVLHYRTTVAHVLKTY